MKLKVLVIDDSVLQCALLMGIINKNKDMMVVACAHDSSGAREAIKLHDPDVITLDVDMPNVNGLDFLERLMRLRPIPVIMVSALMEDHSQLVERALKLGAVDVIGKAKLNSRDDVKSFTELLAGKIRQAVQPARLRKNENKAGELVQNWNGKNDGYLYSPLLLNEKLIAIGASTGGTEAVASLLKEMPIECPGIVIAQHMLAGFTRSFAKRMNSLCQIMVKEAESGEIISPGCAYLAPSDQHLSVVKEGVHYVAQLDNGAPVNHHKPSVDVLFSSVARCAGKHGVGVILTGMGKDGVEGLLHMKQAGAYNFAQNEESCVVYGMPKEAVARGAVDAVADLKLLPGLVLQHLGIRQ